MKPIMIMEYSYGKKLLDFWGIDPLKSGGMAALFDFCYTCNVLILLTLLTDFSS